VTACCSIWSAPRWRCGRELGLSVPGRGLADAATGFRLSGSSADATTRAAVVPSSALPEKHGTAPAQGTPPHERYPSVQRCEHRRELVASCAFQERCPALRAGRNHDIAQVNGGSSVDVGAKDDACPQPPSLRSSCWWSADPASSTDPLSWGCGVARPSLLRLAGDDNPGHSGVDLPADTAGIGDRLVGSGDPRRPSCSADKAQLGVQRP
jgi:hypothetical protein